jgi:hypothetical protein
VIKKINYARAVRETAHSFKLKATKIFYILEKSYLADPCNAWLLPSSKAC